MGQLYLRVVLSFFSPLFLALFLVIAACSAPSVKEESAKITLPPLEITAKQGWEMKWDKILSEAQKEKKVVIATGQTASVRAAIMEGFKNSHNLEIEFIVASGQELSNRTITQRKAGIFATDIILTGNTTIVQVLKPLGMFENLLPQLILPEVVDTKNWYENKIQFADRDGKVLFIVLSPQLNLVANSNLVKKDEINSYKALLNPRWEGKIVMADPTVPGIGQEFIFATIKSYGVDYLRDLVKQKPVIMRNERLQVEWVAQGKYHIGIGGTPIAREFEKDGAPLFFPAITEGQSTLAIGYGGLALFDRAPHPDAAEVFINWLFSRDGQLIYSKADERQSVRVDVSADHLPWYNRRAPGVSYIKSSDEDNLLIRDENMAIAREVFGPLVK